MIIRLDRGVGKAIAQREFAARRRQNSKMPRYRIARPGEGGEVEAGRDDQSGIHQRIIALGRGASKGSDGLAKGGYSGRLLLTWCLHGFGGRRTVLLSHCLLVGSTGIEPVTPAV